MVKITSFAASITFICTIASIGVFVNIRSSEDAILHHRDERSRTIRTKVGLRSYSPRDTSFPNPRRVEETTGSTKDDKICVMHVGPHKTSTTTLQDFLKEPVAKDALKRDNYKGPSFPGSPKTNAKLATCFRPRECPIENMKKNFASFVSDAAMNDSNILLTSEEFAEPNLNITELMSYLAPEYKIHVVVYYRRFYDWIYSLYNQLIKMGRLYKAEAEPITFVEWLDLETTFEDAKESLSPAVVYDRYTKAPEVFNVTVVNMHEDPDNFNTLTRFTCDHMDNAPELCKVAKSYRSDGNHNLSTDLNWRIFRATIRHHHSIQLSDDDERWEQIEEKFYQMTDIPQVCLSTEWKDKLLQTSLEAEIALTPEWWYNSEEGLENLKSDFEEKINSKFCSMNVNAILTSSEWQNFLTELEEDAVEEES